MEQHGSSMAGVVWGSIERQEALFKTSEWQERLWSIWEQHAMSMRSIEQHENGWISIGYHGVAQE